MDKELTQKNINKGMLVHIHFGFISQRTVSKSLSFVTNVNGKRCAVSDSKKNYEEITPSSHSSFKVT
jgi:hypothetical protein